MPAELSNPYDILAFHAESGVDLALEESPQNRFEESAATSSFTSPLAGEVDRAAIGRGVSGERPRLESPLSPSLSHSQVGLARPDQINRGRTQEHLRSAGRGSHATSPPVSTPPVAPDTAALAAREMAAKAKTLDELRDILSRFEGCELKKTAKNLVFADGTPGARVMFVGEAPGADEDREGLPFVGRSGKLLDLMMHAIGLDRTSAYIANIVPWRPPGNRTPTPQETSICLPFIRRQIELANPDFLICLGKPSMQTLLGIHEGIKASRGRWRDFDTGTRTIKAMATFHPAYLLRTPIEKKFVWRDMLALKKALAEN